MNSSSKNNVVAGGEARETNSWGVNLKFIMRIRKEGGGACGISL